MCSTAATSKHPTLPLCADPRKRQSSQGEKWKARLSSRTLLWAGVGPVCQSLNRSLPNCGGSSCPGTFVRLAGSGAEEVLWDWCQAGYRPEASKQAVPKGQEDKPMDENPRVSLLPSSTGQRSQGDPRSAPLGQGVPVTLAALVGWGLGSSSQDS